SDEISVSKGGDEIGRVSRFESLSRDSSPATVGTIYSSPETGTWEVYGPIFTEWQLQMGPVGRLGFPTSPPRMTPNGAGRFQNFQGGMIVWNLEDGAVTIVGGISLRLFRFTVDDDFNVQFNVVASSGESNHGRMPPDGEYEEGSEDFPPATLLTINKVTSDL